MLDILIIRIDYSEIKNIGLHIDAIKRSHDINNSYYFSSDDNYKFIIDALFTK